MPSATRGEVAGWKSVVLESDALRAVVLPEKGAELHSLVDRATDTEILFQAPWGLNPPDAPPLEGSGDDEFMWNYAGGWQELFPSVNDTCTYRGRRIPFHGEVASLAWTCESSGDGPAGPSATFVTTCRQTPFSLRRTVTVAKTGSALDVESVATNHSHEPAHLVWGQHLVIGPPFLEPGCRLDLPARRLVTAPTLWEPETARLEPGQEEPWPHARLRSGGTVDLSEIPGAETHSHDELYVTDLDEGRLAVLNERRGLAVELTWDSDLYPWVIVWQPYGGAEALPLRGSYALGIEPWTSRQNLEESEAAGTAIELAPGESLKSLVRIRTRNI
jgi:galactose mutarotase-like enzyme